eukprot:COSAG02_NODE_22423_length_753_cov_1.019878_1_plen_129_part_00
MTTDICANSSHAALTDERFDKRKRPENLIEAVELLPELPAKVYIGNSFAPAVVEERRAKLRTFLHMVVALPDAAHLAYVMPQHGLCGSESSQQHLFDCHGRLMRAATFLQSSAEISAPAGRGAGRRGR